MSGPLAAEDAAADASRPGGLPSAAPTTVEITDSRQAEVGSVSVRRALPQRQRRTVGAWCFADHMGPAEVTADGGLDIGPHPHMGLQTVTWLLSGEVVHRDSLGSEQLIRPGQLNLMTAGRGVAHSEEGTGTYRGELQGIQLWVAQPRSTRQGEPAFEHHADLPAVDLPGCRATVIVGEFGEVSSPARRDTDHLGIDIDLFGPMTVLPLRPEFEYALIVLVGAVVTDGRRIEPGQLAYFGTGRHECRLDVATNTRAMFLGGVPFEDPIIMWWNFVGRDRQEMVEAYRHWSGDDGWFGRVDSRLARIPVGPPPWLGAPS